MPLPLARLDKPHGEGRIGAFHVQKGMLPDNSACEGLFGRLKNEMLYNREWTGVSIQEFIDILNEYLVWYNE